MHKRVLHIIPGYGGGISSLVRNIVVNCDSSKIINDVVGFSEYPDFFLKEVSAQNSKAYTIPSVHSGAGKSIKAFYKIVKENHYDAVHIHVRENQFIYFALISKAAGCKRVIAHAHIADDERMKFAIYRQKMRFWRSMTRLLADQLASCSKMASAFVYGDVAVRKNKVMHIPNGVNLSLYEPVVMEDKNVARKNCGIKDEKFVIGNVGYLGYQKNHPFMLQIAEVLKNKNIDFKMIFVGTGWAEDDLKSLCREKELDEYVVFAGRRNDVPELFRSMDVAILPSFYEGLPTVAVEAQAAGVPQVVSDTVTREVDLGMGMIKYLPIDRGPELWADEILKAANVKVPEWSKRKSEIEKHYFTGKTAADLYTKFIYGEISTYNLT